MVLNLQADTRERQEHLASALSKFNDSTVDLDALLKEAKEAKGEGEAEAAAAVEEKGVPSVPPAEEAAEAVAAEAAKPAEQAPAEETAVAEEGAAPAEAARHPSPPP